ncbi:MAG TPA: SCO family protein [Candidatus Saccharimonadales bacterium]|nr:SCO family protein [Candidatus Saccharimonadales bacterium]
MNQNSRKIEWVVWGALTLTIIAILGAFIYSKIVGAEESRVQSPLTTGLPAFNMTNQFGEVVTAESLKGKVLLVDIIFTQCGGPCPKMTQRMADLQSQLPQQLPVKLVTLTTDPEHDSPAVLKRYGEKFGADFKRWMFLTGTKTNLAVLARDGLKLVAEEIKPEDRVSPDDLFLHSTIFVLLDKHGRLRGSFDSTEEGFLARVTKALKAVAKER